MIRFTLACSAAHEFEAWFANSASFDTQRASGAVTCPVCGVSDVRKALMTPALATSGGKETVRLAANSPGEGELIKMLRQVREHLTSNAEYVGDRFAAEARRIHLEEVEKRGIYGEATLEEVRGLADEGIEFHPLPRLPEDHN